MGKRNAAYQHSAGNAQKNCFSTLTYVLLIFRKIYRAISYKMNVPQPANMSYKLCFHFITSLSMLYQATCKLFVNSSSFGTQAVVQGVGEHQDSSIRCHLPAPAFASKEMKDILCTAFLPFTDKLSVPTHQGC